MNIAIIVGAIIIAFAIHALFNENAEAKRKERSAMDIFQNAQEKLLKAQSLEENIQQREKAINFLLANKFKDTSLFVKLYRNYVDEINYAILLKTEWKNPPAQSTMQKIKDLNFWVNKLQAREKELQYDILKYEQLFPWITQYKDCDISLTTNEFYEKNNLPPNLTSLYKEKDDLCRFISEKQKLQENIEKEKQVLENELAEIRLALIEERRKFKQEITLKTSEIEKEFQEKQIEFDKETKKKEQLFNLKVKEIPVLADFFCELEKERAKLIEERLMNKKNPAPKAAEDVRIISCEKRNLIRELKTVTYTLKYYENIIPWLSELEDEPLSSAQETNTLNPEWRKTGDEAGFWLSPDEYRNLPTVEKYQRALDRYFNRNKSNAEIGRDYERYIGYLYEKKGYTVEYVGIIEGLEDLGRDLICKKGSATCVIQCKCWSAKKTIHEKHINQLFGTTVRYYLEQAHEDANLVDFYNSLKTGKIAPVFITSTVLSGTAKDFAKSLGIQFKEDIKLEPYPTIKCNVNRSTGEKIYHLPFDQQYDKTVIKDKDEFYALTVAEAESEGFRRANRWLGV